MVEPHPPQLTEAFERARRARERELARTSDDPLLWTLVGVLLISLFVLALSIHWFPK